MSDPLHSNTDAQRFAEALALANIPTLLMVMVQLTGNLRWLEPPYRPRRAQGMSDNDTGGLPDDIQGEIRAMRRLKTCPSSGARPPCRKSTASSPA